MRRGGGAAGLTKTDGALGGFAEAGPEIQCCGYGDDWEDGNPDQPAGHGDRDGRVGASFAPDGSWGGWAFLVAAERIRQWVAIFRCGGFVWKPSARGGGAKERAAR